MRSNPWCIFLALCCASSPSSAAYSTAAPGSFSAVTATRQQLRSTAGGAMLGWTPGRVVSRLNVDGQEVVFRVVNGEPGKAGELPYQISLRRKVAKSEFFLNFCGATIITATELLSAGHCFRSIEFFDSCCRHSGRADDTQVKGVWAVAGSLHAVSHYHGGADSVEHGQWRKLRTVLYPTDSSFPRNDIAVVFLTAPFLWTETVKPIPYAVVHKDYEGTCLVSGYGRTENNTRSQILLKAELRVLSIRQCSKLHNKDMSAFVCTSDESSNIAKGDSGGPLVCKNSNDPKEINKSVGVLVGVVSGSQTNIRDGSFFARVSAHNKFIEESLNSGATSLRTALVTTCVILFLLFI